MRTARATAEKHTEYIEDTTVLVVDGYGGDVRVEDSDVGGARVVVELPSV